MFEIHLNGSSHSVSPKHTVSTLLRELNVSNKLVIVEINGSVIKRDDHDSLKICPGDKLELIQLMGGG